MVTSATHRVILQLKHAHVQSLRDHLCIIRGDLGPLVWRGGARHGDVTWPPWAETAVEWKVIAKIINIFPLKIQSNSKSYKHFLVGNISH